MNPISIVGGGPAGLAVGYYLNKHNVPSTILEADSTLGGVCRTLIFDDVRYDLGAHRLHNIFPEITQEIRTLLGDDLQEVNVPSRVLHNGKWAIFPLTPFGLVKTMGLRATTESFLSILLGNNREGENFRDDAMRKYGPDVAERFLINYSEKLWGMSADTLSPDISGKRLHGLNLRSLLRDVFFKKHAEHLDGAFFYPRLGFGQITDALASQCGRTECDSRVVGVYCKNHRITDLELADGSRRTCDLLISTIPVSSLLSILRPSPPTEIVDISRSLRFRSLRLVVLTVARPFVVRSASLYFPDREIPFSRIYEPKNRSAAMAPADKTCLVVEYPCFQGDKTDTQSDSDLIDATKSVITRLGLVSGNEFLNALTKRVPDAYPVLTLTAKAQLPQLFKYLDSFENLHLSGRTARFEYTHFHDVMRQGKALAARVAADYRSGASK